MSVDGGKPSKVHRRTSVSLSTAPSAAPPPLHRWTPPPRDVTASCLPVVLCCPPPPALRPPPSLRPPPCSGLGWRWGWARRWWLACSPWRWPTACSATSAATTPSWRLARWERAREMQSFTQPDESRSSGSEALCNTLTDCTCTCTCTCTARRPPLRTASPWSRTAPTAARARGETCPPSSDVIE